MLQHAPALNRRFPEVESGIKRKPAHYACRLKGGLFFLVHRQYGYNKASKRNREHQALENCH